jgi:ABC-type sugar transport system ATPase subunit
VLEVEGLEVRAGAFALRDIDLAVAEGECHAVLGPSGSGKSTLLAAVLGIRAPIRGRVRLGEQDVTGLPTEQRGLGYVPQGLGLFPHLTVAENLAYSARARRLATSEYRTLLGRLVEVTGVGPLLDRRPPTLSGGERQRVALVRALASRPRLVLLDEPFTALNESLRRDLWWLVRALRRDEGLTVLLVTHDLTEAFFLAERIGVLIDGRLEQCGPRETVYRRPATLAVARFLGIKNLIPGVTRSMQGQWMRVDCPLLGRVVAVPSEGASPAPGTRVVLGIRPEEIALRDAEHPPHEGEVVLEGQFDLSDLGAQTLVHFHHDASPLVLELQISGRVARRFGLYDGRPGVAVGLPADALFWVPENATSTSGAQRLYSPGGTP